MPSKTLERRFAEPFAVQCYDVWAALRMSEFCSFAMDCPSPITGLFKEGLFLSALEARSSGTTVVPAVVTSGRAVRIL